MKDVYLIDADGFYIGIRSVPVEEPTPENCVEVVPTQNVGIYKHKWTGSEWVEGATASEIEAINNPIRPKTLEERLAEAEETIALLQQQLANK